MPRVIPLMLMYQIGAYGSQLWGEVYGVVVLDSLWVNGFG